MKSIAKYATFTRPVDTNQYDQYDVVCGDDGKAVQFVGGIGSKSMTINRAVLQKSTNTTTNAKFSLYVFSAAPRDNVDGSPINSDPFDPTTPFKYLGEIAFPIISSIIPGITTGASSDTGILSATLKISSNSLFSGNIVYGTLVNTTATGYVPGSNEVFGITLYISPDDQGK